jgi:O-antigen ligase
MNRLNLRILFLFLIVVVLAIFAGKGLLRLSSSSEEIAWNIKFIVLGAVNIFLVFALLFNYEKTKRYIPYILAIYIANTGFTFEYKSGYQSSANEALTFAILIIWLVRRLISQRSLSRRPYFSTNAKIFLLFSAMGILTAYFGFGVQPLNILTLFKSYTLYLFYLFLIPDCVRSERELHKILIFILIVSLVPLYYAVTGSMSIENVAQERLSVTGWGALNIFVGYILPVFFVSFGLLFYKTAKWQKLLIVLYIGAIVYLLFLTQTRTGWGALVAGIGLFVFMTKKKLPAFAVGVILAIGLMYSPLGQNVENVVTQRIVEQTLNPDHSLRERYSRWEGAWDTAKTYPLTGSGWGALLPVAWDGTVGDTSTSLLPLWHNGYLEVLSQLGIPGLLVFLLLWGKIMKVEGVSLYLAPRSRQPTINVGLFVAVVACLIYALAEQQFYRIETASHTYFLAGLLIAANRLQTNMMKSSYA